MEASLGFPGSAARLLGDREPDNHILCYLRQGLKHGRQRRVEITGDSRDADSAEVLRTPHAGQHDRNLIERAMGKRFGIDWQSGLDIQRT